MPLLRCRYGAHPSKEEVAKLVAPHPDTLKLVHSWLAHHGVQSSSISMTHGGNWLTVKGVLVSQAKEMLGESYQLYRHAGTNDTAILRTVGYALPTVLHAHVQTVVPTTFFASARALQQTPHRHSAGAAGPPAKAEPREPVMVLSSNDGPEGVTPEAVRRLYNTYTYEPTRIVKNELGIAGFINEFPSPTDLTSFMTLFRPNAVDATFFVELINNGWFDQSQPGTEGNLNMQYAQAIAYPTTHVFYSIGGEARWSLSDGEVAPDDQFFVWLTYMIIQPNIPRTITISYGINEKNVPAQYARSICNLFAQLGACGVSILFSTGDNGVGEGDCKDGSGKV